MAAASFLKNQTPSPLLSQSYLNPNGGNIKKKAAGLMLTSLVDAFSILVIYLLFGPALTGESVSPTIGVQLPVAFQAELTDRETTITVKDNKYYIQEQEIPVSQLGNSLKKIAGTLKTTPNKALVIIADKENGVEKLNPVLIAASEAGLSQLRLAVEQQGD